MTIYEILNKRTTIITENPPEGTVYVLNPFNEDGTVGIDTMSVIVQIPDWNSTTLFFYVPDMVQLQNLNFQAKFTSYTDQVLLGSGPTIAAGNDVDSWDNGFLYGQGVMTWIPQAYQPTLNGSYGWWLVDQPVIPFSETPLLQGSLPMGASQETSTVIGGSEAFRQLISELKK